jgi:hypothetical protein
VTPFGSLLYPLWDLNGLAFLMFLPPLTSVASLLSVGLVPHYVLGDDEVRKLGALTMVAPMFVFLAMLLGYISLYLAEIIRGAAFGEVHHPRLPAWKTGPALAGLGRWVSCLACGLALAVPAIVATGVPNRASSVQHWLATALIAAAGIAYGQMALVAVLLFEDIRAANPFTVLGALARVGLGSLPVAVLTGTAAALVSVFAVALFRLSGFWAFLATWAFWVLTVYLLMAVSRAIGLFYRRYAKRLGWFPERAQWGVRG